MAIVLDKVITRDAGNTINTSTNYSELNVKAEGLIDDLVANIEGNAATQETYINSNVDTMTTQIASLIDPTGTGYTTEYSDATTKTQNESNFTASGHTKLPKAYIETDTPYTMIDPSTDAINVGGRLVEVVGEELVTNGTFDSDISGWIDISTGTGSVSVVSGQLQLVRNDVNNRGFIAQAIATTIGVPYKFQITQISGDAYIATSSTQAGGELFSSLLSQGVNIFSFIPTTATTYINLRGITDGTQVIDNISVKEIQPIVLPNAPFDTDTSHTTTTYSATQAVSKGDFVVSGQELVTNGTFDTDIAWSKNVSGVVTPSPSGIISGGVATISSSGGFVAINQNIGSTADAVYTVRLEVTRVGSGSIKILTAPAENGASGSEHLSDISTVGFHEVNISTTDEWLIIGRVGACDIDLDNISVTLKDDIVQATRDSVDMYTYDDTQNISTWNIGEVALCTGANTNGVTGHYYYNFGSNGANPSTTSFNSAFYRDLGTASTMSLANPYFQNVSVDENGNTSQLAVTRDDVWMHLVTKDTYTYSKHSFKGIYQFTENVIADEVMQTYCGSPISPNLYEITVNGTDYYAVFGGMSTRLNAGSFHPSYNIMGTRLFENTDASADYWYQISEELSTYKSFFIGGDGVIGVSNTAGVATTGAIGNVSVGASNSAYYDKAYNNQVTLRTPLAFTPSKSDMLEETATDYANGQIDGVEGLVEMYEAVTTNAAQAMYIYASLPKDELLAGSKQAAFRYDGLTDTSVIYVTDGTSHAIGWYVAGIVVLINSGFTENTYYAASDLTVYITKKSNIKYSGELPHTDLIGNPSNYPSMITDTLASGKSVYLNPLLVGQDGSDYVPSGNAIARTWSKKVILSNTVSGLDSLVISLDSGDSWLVRTDNSGYETSAILNAQEAVTTNAGNIYIANYTAKTKSTIKRNDIEIVQVLPKVFASNSHSIYKGGNAVYSAGMGVSTGDTFESKVLENNTFIHTNTDSEIPIDLISGKTKVLFYINTNATHGGIYRFIGASDVLGYTGIQTTSINGNAAWESLGALMTPTHNTIALDSSGDKAVKYFLALGKDSDNNAYGVVASKEIDFDVDSGDTGLFEQLIDGTDTDDNGNIVKTDVSYIPLNYKMEN